MRGQRVRGEMPATDYRGNSFREFSESARRALSELDARSRLSANAPNFGAAATQTIALLISASLSESRRTVFFRSPHSRFGCSLPPCPPPIPHPPVPEVQPDLTSASSRNRNYPERSNALRVRARARARERERERERGEPCAPSLRRMISARKMPDVNYSRRRTGGKIFSSPSNSGGAQ